MAETDAAPAVPPTTAEVPAPEGAPATTEAVAATATETVTAASVTASDTAPAWIENATVEEATTTSTAPAAVATSATTAETPSVVDATAPPPGTADASATGPATTTAAPEPSPKLFAGQLPRAWTEAQLRPIFEEFGPLLDFSLLRNKMTGESRGCGFVVYQRREDGERAIAELGGKRTLPGMANPVVMNVANQRPAGGNTPTAGAAGQQQNKKLFVAPVMDEHTDEDLRKLFSLYGTVEDVHILRKPDGSSRRCGFVTFTDADSCQRAIQGLNEIYTLPGAPRPLQVRYADTPQQRDARKRAPAMGGMPGAYGGFTGLPQQPFYGGVPMGGMPGAAPAYGGAYPGMVPQGGQPGAYGGAVPGGYAQPGMGFDPSGGMQAYGGAYGAAGVGMMPNGAMAAPQPGVGMPGMGGAGGAAGRPKEGPEGANLFVYNIPVEFGDHELVATFSPFGNVVSATVYRDKMTGASKGFGFVSFDDASNAHNAIQAMNGMAIGGRRLKVELKQRRGGGGRPY